MKILFTKSDKCGSRIIRWGLDEPVSHVALEDRGIVLHSSWSGVDLDSKATFLRNREIVYTIDCPRLNRRTVLKMADQYEGKPYDFSALLFFVGAALWRKLWKRPLPEVNKWNRPGTFLCTELATMLISGEERASITPYGLYKKLSEKDK